MAIEDDENANLFYEFGKFICEFANAENFVHMLFSNVSALDGKYSRAIVGGQTLARVMEVTKRMAGLRDDKQKLEEITYLFNQLSLIAAFRDALLHRGIEVMTTRLQSSNAFTAKTKEAIEQLTFELSHIQNATRDLGLIIMRMGFLVSPHLRLRMEKDDPSVNEIWRAPWQYKDVRLSIENRPHHKGRRKPARQRRASPK